MKRTIFFCIIIYMAVSFSFTTAQMFPAANMDSIRADMKYLGSDALKGRATGSPGLQKAAQYISAKLAVYGLTPGGQNNSWFQKVPMHGTTTLASSTLQIYYNNNNRYLLYNKDFLLIKTGSESYVPGLLPVIFCGYGISAPEYKYDDYKNMDVAGKIVLFFDGEPQSTDPGFFDGKENTIYALPESKIRTAIAHGAVGSIIISDPTQSKANSWAKKRSEYSFEEVSLPGRVTGHIAIYLNPSSAHLFFEGSGTTYKALLQKKGNHTLTSFMLKTKTAFNGEFKRREFKSNNIIACIGGRDSLLKKDYLLIGAHYDHLGTGEPVNGDSIYNGVMDNASGTAVVMELARMFAQADFRPRRSILFVFFCGEEKGLLGSEYYTSHPEEPLNNTIAMVNIDGLSAMGKFKSVIAVGGNYSDLGESLHDVAAEYGYDLEVLKKSGFETPYTRSDQLSFAQAGIPAIQVLEGYAYPDVSRNTAIQRTRQWYEKYYHTPLDDLHQAIDYEAIVRYTNLLFVYCNHLLNQKNALRWYSNAPYRRKMNSQ